MEILIDADACQVVSLIENVAEDDTRFEESLARPLQKIF